MASKGHSTEYTDSRISLFSAQKGKCAICGDEFQSASVIVAWLKKPLIYGGEERYKNMILLHERYLPLLLLNNRAELKAKTKALHMTKKQVSKINGLRKQARLKPLDL